jgi:hypothetical protein
MICMRLLPATSGAYIPSALSPLAFVIAAKERAFMSWKARSMIILLPQDMINDNLASMVYYENIESIEYWVS